MGSRKATMGGMCISATPIRSHAELSALGLTRRQIAVAVRSGTATPLRRGVYAHVDACAPARRAAAHGGTLACSVAARHLGLWVLSEDEDDVHVWMRRGGHAYPHSDDACTCVEHWDDGVGTSAFGLPPVRNVLLQILRCHGVEHFFVALESALNQRMLAPEDIHALRRLAGRAGRQALALAQDDSESGLESLLRWRLRAHRLPIRTQQWIHDTGRVDILIGERLLIEADGKQNHDDPSRRHKDLVRDAKSASWGYVTLRFDYALIVHDWPLVESAILGQIAAGHHL